MIFPPKQGRPFGGRAFLIKKSLNVTKGEFINTNISYVTYNYSTSTISLIAVYMPFDNSSQLNLIDFQSSLEIINALNNLFLSKNHIVLLMGDFNADFNYFKKR